MQLLQKQLDCLSVLLLYLVLRRVANCLNMVQQYNLRFAFIGWAY